MRVGARSGLLLAALVAAVATPETAAAETRSFTATAGVSYSSGDFGARNDARTVYLPLTLKYQRGRFTTRVTLPFLEVRERRARAGRASLRSTQRGLGDIVTSFSYRFEPWSDYAPSIRLTGKVKLPTAEDGLGSGDFDYAGQVALSKTLYDRFTPYLELGYRMRGDARGSDADSRMLASLGFSYDVSSRLNLGLGYDFRQRSRSGFEDVRELVPYGSLALSRTTRLGFYGIVGLSDASPDLGAGLSLSYRLD